MKLFFDNGGGTKLCGLLEMPSAKCPIVILCHGFASSKESSKYEALVPALAAKGIGSFRFDFYGHGESQGDFERITLSEGVLDIIAAYKYLRQQHPNSKIGLCGSSYGGAAAFYAASQLHLAGLVLLCPAAYYKELEQKNETEWQQGQRTYTDWKGEEQKVNSVFYEDLAKFIPEHVGERITTPTLIIHGTADDIVPHEHSERLARLIPESELKSYPNGDHRFSHEVDKVRLQHDIVAFFQHVALDNHAQRS